MIHFEQAITKRWIPILIEYEKVKNKVTPRSFRFVKDIYKAHHTSKKEILRYHRKWVEGGKKPEALLPQRRGPKPGSRRTPKDIERNIIKAYRRFGSNRYELVLMFKPFYLDKTPSPATTQPNRFDSMEDLVLNLGNYLFEYNHLRKHGGLNYENPFDKLQKVTELLS